VLNGLFGVTLWCKTMVLRKDKVTHCLIVMRPRAFFVLYSVPHCGTLARLLRNTGRNTTSFGHSLKTFFSLRVLVHSAH